MCGLLGEDIALVQPNNLYRCLDKLTAHKQAMFTFLGERWKDLFQADFEVLLYDLTSTYFECDPPGDGKRKFGYSRDKRSDCVQVVIALIVTPDGFPLAYEVMDGNTSDKTTLKEFLAKIEKQYGKAKRTWVMDRGIPTEEVLAEMRNSETPIHYLVGSPRGRLTQLEKAFLTKPWEDVRESVRVKLIEHGRVDEGVAPPHPSQIRMCRFPASGSSWESLARGGVDDTIRDSPARKVARVSPRCRSCQFSYPLSFRGQVCETQSPLPCCPSTVLSARHPSSLDRVPVSPVPQRHRSY